MVIVTGGGTGGHFYPGLAAARALIELGQPVTYVGARGGIEERALPDSGLPHRIIPAGKFSREALRPGEGLKLVSGLWHGWKAVRELQPRAILSMGGYAGFPAAFMGALAGVPTVVHEQNAKLGIASKVLARQARKVLLSTPIDTGALMAKTQVVGYPVREQRADKAGAKQQLGLDPARPAVFVMGGSQGSKELNDRLPERLYPLLEQGWQVLHQCGRRWEGELQPKARPHYQIRGYVDTVLAWSAAEFAITRGGAGTLAEAAYHSVPVLGVPLSADLDSGAQRANVGFYAAAGAARMLGDWSRFHDELNALLDPSTRAVMRDRLAGLSPAGAARRLAQVVLEVMT
ncbi:MAG: UDP-N-acetylglucosamine--N-acetylmuramyl-(pentapeptide) pyrophosphoryl-undecaprenol N-acetylglucosamine transferase [Meiothermus sp.]|nr:UDP-N-acetylglucosamine--N-acetylmuramyl-(pentapeptide) pyrophosphoryl-undecaprenol N-acetylglucosamine transferase [Meiothermus sp.]